MTEVVNRFVMNESADSILSLYMSLGTPGGPRYSPVLTDIDYFHPNTVDVRRSYLSVSQNSISKILSNHY